MNKNDDNLEEIKKSPSKVKLFFEYYKHVPAFKALVKLCLYFIFFAVIISVVACNQEVINQDSKKETTEEQQKTKLTYKEILDALTTSESQITYNITINEESYRIDANYKENILSGMYRTKDILREFKIQDNIIYEIGLNEEIVNQELFGDISLDYLLPSNLISLLENNKVTKMLEDGLTTYNYEIETTKYKVVVKDECISQIEIKNELFNYIIEYNKSEVN